MGGRLVSPRAKVRVCDPESGEVLPIGEAGELQMQGPSRMSEYFLNPDATAQTVIDGGWVRTGDLGRLESESCFEFIARMGDAMRLGGFLTSPAEIEDEVKQCAGVENVQVVAATGPKGPRAVAFVIAEPGEKVDVSEVQAHCARRLARYKVPAHVEVVSEFPVTLSANGTKIQRAKLRDMAEALLNRAAP